MAQRLGLDIINIVISKSTKVDDLLTVDEAAETFQNLLDLVNDKKYKPLLDFLNKRGE